MSYYQYQVLSGYFQSRSTWYFPGVRKFSGSTWEPTILTLISHERHGYKVNGIGSEAHVRRQHKSTMNYNSKNVGDF